VALVGLGVGSAGSARALISASVRSCPPVALCGANGVGELGCRVPQLCRMYTATRCVIAPGPLGVQLQTVSDLAPIGGLDRPWVRAGGSV